VPAFTRLRSTITTTPGRLRASMYGSSPAVSLVKKRLRPSLTTRGGGSSVWLSQYHHFFHIGGALLL